MENRWEYLRNGLGPVCLSFAAFYAYKKFIHVPLPFTTPIAIRNHMIKGNSSTLNAVDKLAHDKFVDPLIKKSDKLFIKVLTYNILADCYSKYFMFKYVNHGYLNFKYRSHRILHEIRESNSDIICL